MFLQTDFKAGDPVRKVANAHNLNRIGNILMDVQGIGCRVVKSFTAEGLGWRIVCDGTSDIDPPAGATTSDRLYAVDSVSRGRLGKDNLHGLDSVGFQDTHDILVSFDVCADTTFLGVAHKQIRPYLKVDGVSTSPTHILGRDASGSLVWVAAVDTCAPPS